MTSQSIVGITGVVSANAAWCQFPHRSENRKAQALHPIGAPGPMEMVKKLERAKGFEPSTPTLARLCSTPELRPLWRVEWVSAGWHCRGQGRAASIDSAGWQGLNLGLANSLGRPHIRAKQFSP
jgi:hypothetical protein